MRRLLILVAMALLATACSGSGGDTSTTTSLPPDTSTTTPDDGTTTQPGDGGTTTTGPDATTTTTQPGDTTTTTGADTTTTTSGDTTTTTAPTETTTTTTAPPSGDRFALDGTTVALPLVCAGGSEEGTIYRGASGEGDTLSLFVTAGGVLDSLEIANATGEYAGTAPDVTAEVSGGRLVGGGEVALVGDEADPVAASFDIVADPGPCPGLRGDGLSTVDFGTDGDEAVSDLGLLFGPAINDTGWLDAVDNGCRGTVVRFVIWEDAFALLTDAATPFGSAGSRHFAFWGAPEGTALASEDGIQPGISTVGDVPGANPVFDPLYDAFIFEVDGVVYEAESADPGEIIIGASAGDRSICGE